MIFPTPPETTGRVFDFAAALLALLADPAAAKTALEELRKTDAELDGKLEELRQRTVDVTQREAAVVAREGALEINDGVLKVRQAKLDEDMGVFDARLRDEGNALTQRERAAAVREQAATQAAEEAAALQAAAEQQLAEALAQRTDLEAREADYAARVAKLKALAGG